MRYLSAGFFILFVSCSGCPFQKQGFIEKEDQAPLATGAQETLPASTDLPPSGKITTPLDAIKDMDVEVDRYNTGFNLTEEELEQNRRLKEKILKGAFDIAELCRLALASHWDPLNSGEKDRFVHLMTSLLERKAVFSKEQVRSEGKPYAISYKSQQYLDDQKSRATVTTSIHVPSKHVTAAINYHLKLTPAGWKIFDVIVDEASLVENYKFQFDTIIKKYGYPELVRRMESKLKSME